MSLVRDDELTTELRTQRRLTLFRVLMLGAVFVLVLVWLVRGVLDQPHTPDNYTNSYSPSPAGHHAFVALLREKGYRVSQQSVVAKTVDGKDSNEALNLIFEPLPSLSSEYAQALESLVGQSDVVLVLPKRAYKAPEGLSSQGDDSAETASVVLTEGEYSLGAVEVVLDAAGVSEGLSVERVSDPTSIALADGRYETWLEQGEVGLQYFDIDLGFDYRDVVLMSEHGLPVAITLDRGATTLTLVSDPDLFSNRFLATDYAADLGLAVIGRDKRRREIVIDESLHGFTSDASVEYLAATPPGLWVTLSLLLMLGLFAWREVATARKSPEDAQGRRSRAYVIEGVARLMARARDYPAATKRLHKRAESMIVRDRLPIEREKLDALKSHSATGALGLIHAARDVSQLLKKEEHGRRTQREHNTDE